MNTTQRRKTTFYVFKMTILLLLNEKFALFHLNVVGSDLTLAAFSCKPEFGVRAVNVELSLFAVFLSFKQVFYFSGD